jgi:ADP-ribose pyrophosphatase YjhB (NUDIX family)
VLIIEGDQVLLGKRLGEIGAGKWAIPSGYVEYDEDFLSAAQREVLEETGLQIQIEAIINVESDFLTPQQHILTAYLLAHVTGGEMAAGDDLEEVRWFTWRITAGDGSHIDLIQAISHTL